MIIANVLRDPPSEELTEAAEEPLPTGQVSSSLTVTEQLTPAGPPPSPSTYKCKQKTLSQCYGMISNMRCSKTNISEKLERISYHNQLTCMLFWNGCQFRHYFTKESNKIAKVLRRSLAFNKVKRKCNCEFFFEIIHGQLVRNSSPYHLTDMQMCTKPEAPYH